ncbi:MAG: Ubiquinone biosynthesis O-methyltransferase [Pelotomaculum sp. PtaB.Bin104]|nr:MAG: Ubiquinone biosynthesis O-methyltransferase [Pelotomaculum sp. PtaB.Bin104]
MNSGLPKENIYGHIKKLRFILENIKKYKSMHGDLISLLDFGCGNGSAVSQFLIQDGVNYYGIDIHEPSLDYAKKHFANENALFINHIPEGILFDVIVYADVLEHLDDPISILQQHYNLLKENGIIIGAVPNGFGPFENEKRIDKFLGFSRGILLASKIKRRMLKRISSSRSSIIPYNSDSGHVQFFTKKSLLLTLQKGGFQIKCFRKGAFIGAPLSERILRGKRIIELNSKIADYLPYWAVSTWYFVAKKL